MKRLVSVLLLAACSGSPSEDPAASHPGGKADDGNAPTAELLRCWIEKGTAADPFFRVDALKCHVSDRPAWAALQGGALNYQAGGGRASGGAFVPDGAGDLAVGTVSADAYPVQLSVALDYRTKGDRDPAYGTVAWDDLDVKTEISFASPTAYTAAQPWRATLPFTTWTVDVGAADSVVAEVGPYTVPLAPYTAARGDLRVDAAVVGRGGQPARVILAVPVSATSLPVTLHLAGGNVAAAISGPGSYVASASGLARGTVTLPPPAPDAPPAESAPDAPPAESAPDAAPVDDPSCGHPAQSCCAAGDACVSGYGCFAGSCYTCGGSGDSCCPAGPACGAGLGCFGDRCYACGGSGDSCCPTGPACGDGLACYGDRCYTKQ